jgi:hypothetical protein
MRSFAKSRGLVKMAAADPALAALIRKGCHCEYTGN